MKAKNGLSGRGAVELAVAATCESLERRVMLSKARVVDAGDFYRSGNTQVELLRATDRVIVGFEPASAARVRRLTDGLISKGAPFEGYSRVATLRAGTQLFARTARGPSPMVEDLQQKAQGFAGVKYVAPTFFEKRNQKQRIAVTDRLEVDLRNDVNAGTFFGGEYASYASVDSGQNVFSTILASGGGLSALAKAATLHNDSRVQNVGFLDNSKVLALPLGVIDAGDSYYNYTNEMQESLWRATDRIVVGLYPSSASRQARLETALVAESGPLWGYQIVQHLTNSSLLLKMKAEGTPLSLSSLQARVHDFPQLKYVAPSFFYEDGTRTAAWDQIYVDLKDNVDASSLFGDRFSEVKVAVGVNAFNVTLADGGGIDVLDVAAELRKMSSVEAAEPVFGLTLVPSLTPTDPLYANDPDVRWNLERGSEKGTAQKRLRKGDGGHFL